jgi:hypothetical protein
MTASLGVMVPSVWTRSSNVAKRGWGTLYAANMTAGFLRRRCERRLPSVWSSLLKVKTAVLGTPVWLLEKGKIWERVCVGTYVSRLSPRLSAALRLAGRARICSRSRGQLCAIRVGCPLRCRVVHSLGCALSVDRSWKRRMCWGCCSLYRYRGFPLWGDGRGFCCVSHFIAVVYMYGATSLRDQVLVLCAHRSLRHVVVCTRLCLGRRMFRIGTSSSRC